MLAEAVARLEVKSPGLRGCPPAPLPTIADDLDRVQMTRSISFLHPRLRTISPSCARRGVHDVAVVFHTDTRTGISADAISSCCMASSVARSVIIVVGLCACTFEAGRRFSKLSRKAYCLNVKLFVKPKARRGAPGEGANARPGLGGARARRLSLSRYAVLTRRARARCSVETSLSSASRTTRRAR